MLQVRITHNLGGPAAHGGAEHGSAERGLGDAGPKKSDARPMATSTRPA